MRALSLLILLFFATGCASYRPQSRGYRSPSDYARSAPSGSFHTANTAPYSPQGPFQLSWPVNRVKINRGFRPASDRNHEGVDLGGRRDTPILAAHDGVVVYVGSEFRGYGKMILLEYDHEWATLYAHLDNVDVSPGEVVKAGYDMGGMGRTGAATGVHLHFELLHNRKPVDPLPFLGRINRFARQ